MSVTLASSKSTSLVINMKKNDEIIEDSIIYFDNISDKEKEEAYFRDLSSDSQEAVLEKSKDERFAKV